ncbi:MAG: hypothetical protein JZU55_16625, partial [Afipia sp.]|nr:hypothetical protein [Afipia sp.]
MKVYTGAAGSCVHSSGRCVDGIVIARSEAKQSSLQIRIFRRMWCILGHPVTLLTRPSWTGGRLPDTLRAVFNHALFWRVRLA